MYHPAKNESCRIISLAIALLTIAAVGAGYLLVNALIHGPVLGCGEGSGCGSVLKSSYAYMLPGVPVTAPALLVYLLLISNIVRRRSREESHALQVETLVLIYLIVGAAVFFIGVQAIVLGEFCPYCVATHIAGSTGAVLAALGFRSFRSEAIGLQLKSGLIAGIGLAALAGCQYYFPQNTYIGTDKGTNSMKAFDKSFELGGQRIDLNDVPFRGNIDSGRLMVLLFDYTCASCRTTHRYLHKAETQFGSENFLIVNIPVPLSPSCNSGFTEQLPQHAEACRLAELSLALWKLDNNAHREWDRWMFENGTPINSPNLAEALAMAESLVDPERLKLTLKDPAIEQQIERNVEIWKSNSALLKRNSLPQVIMGGRMFSGAPSSESVLSDLIQEHLELVPIGH